MHVLLCLAMVRLTALPGRIEVQVDGKPFTSFLFGRETRKPYLYPLRAASGTPITRSYPVQTGESPDHPHQKGLWFTHGDVNGYDFWANEDSQVSARTGTVVYVKTEAIRGGAMRLLFEWRDPEGRPLLTEDRTMRITAPANLRVVDFDIRLRAVRRATFADTTEGIFGMRLATALEGRHGGRIRNAEGKSTESECWGEPARWVDYSGAIGAERLGVAVFDHPGNPRHPTTWHVRGYGLFAANPFGLQHFYDDKVKKGRLDAQRVKRPASGAMTLEPGRQARFRYRVVIHGDGTALEPLYREYKEQE